MPPYHPLLVGRRAAVNRRVAGSSPTTAAKRSSQIAEHSGIRGWDARIGGGVEVFAIGTREMEGESGCVRAPKPALNGPVEGEGRREFNWQLTKGRRAALHRERRVMRWPAIGWSSAFSNGAQDAQSLAEPLFWSASRVNTQTATHSASLSAVSGAQVPAVPGRVDLRYLLCHQK